MVLGVSPQAPQHEIRAAYMAAARALHPDKASGSSTTDDAAEEFARVAAAWEAIGEPTARDRHDAQAAAAAASAHSLSNAAARSRDAEVVELEDMEWNDVGDVFTKHCRCGGQHTLTASDIETAAAAHTSWDQRAGTMHGAVLVPCDACSLQVQVQFVVAAASDDDEEEAAR